jgi:hypothetical protein
MLQPCAHAASIRPVPDPLDACQACIEIGGTWRHLRQCLTCGRTLCCDSSPNQHASGHARATGHPILRGADPGDQWTWCMPDDAFIRPGADGWLIDDLDGGTG